MVKSESVDSTDKSGSLPLFFFLPAPTFWLDFPLPLFFPLPAPTCWLDFPLPLLPAPTVWLGFSLFKSVDSMVKSESVDSTDKSGSLPLFFFLPAPTFWLVFPAPLAVSVGPTDKSVGSTDGNGSLPLLFFPFFFVLEPPTANSKTSITRFSVVPPPPPPPPPPPASAAASTTPSSTGFFHLLFGAAPFSRSLSANDCSDTSFGPDSLDV